MLYSAGLLPLPARSPAMMSSSSLKKAPASAAGQTYEYVNPSRILPLCVCSICDEPFIDPCETPCRHNFCTACLTSWPRESGCPLCRGALSPPPADGASGSPAGDIVRPCQDKTLLTLLNDLEVYCANKAGGCR